MPTVKASYEALFVFSVKNGEDAVAELKEKFRALIEQNAEIGEVDDWGKRKLISSTMRRRAGTCCTTSSAVPLSRRSWSASAVSPTACCVPWSSVKTRDKEGLQ